MWAAGAGRVRSVIYENTCSREMLNMQRAAPWCSAIINLLITWILNICVTCSAMCQMPEVNIANTFVILCL